MAGLQPDTTLISIIEQELQEDLTDKGTILLPSNAFNPLGERSLIEDTLCPLSVEDFSHDRFVELWMALKRDQFPRRIHPLDCATWSRAEVLHSFRTRIYDVLVRELQTLLIGQRADSLILMELTSWSFPKRVFPAGVNSIGNTAASHPASLRPTLTPKALPMIWCPKQTPMILMCSILIAMAVYATNLLIQGISLYAEYSMQSLSAPGSRLVIQSFQRARKNPYLTQ